MSASATTEPNESVTFAANPLAALREGRLTRRFTQLFFGLFLYGFSLTFLIESGMGLDPWDVFHQGIFIHTPLSFGTIVILASFVVLLLWIPLKQWPGIGTICNAVVVGLATDLALWLLPTAHGWPMRIGFMIAAVVLNAIATAAYIGARFGPGPRDGLMTGLVRKTGKSVRLIRTSIEVTVLVIGFALGGTVGVGTVVYALAIGPLTQVFLPHLTVRPDVTLRSHE